MIYPKSELQKRIESLKLFCEENQIKIKIEIKETPIDEREERLMEIKTTERLILRSLLHLLENTMPLDHKTFSDDIETEIKQLLNNLTAEGKENER